MTDTIPHLDDQTVILRALLARSTASGITLYEKARAAEIARDILQTKADTDFDLRSKTGRKARVHFRS